MSTPQKDTRFNLMLLLVAGAALALWFWYSKQAAPQKPPPKPDETAKAEKPPVPPPEKEPEKNPAPTPHLKITPDNELVTLGGPQAQLTVKLDPKGAGVRQVVLNHFQEANLLTGRPEWLDADHKVPKPLELIPKGDNGEIGSFLLYHYPNPKSDDSPIDTLGQRVWTVKPVEPKEGESVNEAVFETVVDQTGQPPVRITKTYTLDPHSYHIGLEIKMEVIGDNAKEVTFRYQFTGPHALPIEGQWYTPTYRNVFIGQVDEKGNVERNLQDLREISHKGGGEEVLRGDKRFVYAMVANQFFTSGLAVATRDEKDKIDLAQARPILLSAADKVKLLNPPDDKHLTQLELNAQDASGHTYKFVCDKADINPEHWDRLMSALDTRAEVIIVHRMAIDESHKNIREVVTKVLDPNETAPIFHDDVTVEVSTPRDDHAIRLQPGKAVIHKYDLYNGPLKVRLLNHQIAGAPTVDSAAVAYYMDDLHLDTLTDYPNSWFGRAFSTIGVTQLVLWFTNRMHDILWWIYCVVKFLPDIVVYGLCILLLTVLVRGIMHPLSRKQARTTLRMQALQPELVKLKEKHKDDRQALQMAQMELYRKHGINPLGSCWLMMLQMPVFLGLYYCLQESIQFRLAPFLWIESLTAPDMLWHWGDKIPFLSKWESYGALWYLGPFFNVLPVVAVALMIVQQKMTLPPPADEQAAMQQKMMKYMMIFFGLMFYKIAAGLCLYFIASSLWGFAERKMLPKKKPGDPPDPIPERRPGFMQRLMQRAMEAQRQQQDGRPATGTTATPSPPAAPGGRGKKKRNRGAPGAPAPDETGLLARVRAWWAEVRRQAEKK